MRNKITSGIRRMAVDEGKAMLTSSTGERIVVKVEE